MEIPSLASFITLLARLHFVCGAEYLMVFPGSESSSIMAVTGESEGKYNVVYPDQVKITHTVPSYSVHNHGVRSEMLVVSGLETKTVVVRTDDVSRLKIYGKDKSTFKPLPIPALGTKYVMSSCHVTKGNLSSLLVIASHSKGTNVEIAVRTTGSITYDGKSYSNGDTIGLTIGQYQTITIESESPFTGSVIDSVNSIAVYSGIKENGYLAAYEQLLPEEYLGLTHFVAFDESVIDYTAQIASVYNDTGFNTTITSNGSFSGTFSMKRSNGWYYITSGRPIMVTLCGRNETTGTGMSVVPSLSLFTSESFLPLIGGKIIILTLNDTDTLSVKSTVNLSPVQWVHDGSIGLNIGSLTLPSTPSTSFSIISTATFYVIALSEDSISNGGYFFPFEYLQEDDDETDVIIVGVAAGTGVATTVGMVVGGFVIHRRRRRRESDRDKEERNKKADDKGRGRRDNDSPEDPPVGQA